MTIPRSILYADTHINQGGLMRCCIATITAYVDEHADEDAPDGMTIDCVYEQSSPYRKIILVDGVWRWNRQGAVDAGLLPAGL